MSKHINPQQREPTGIVSEPGVADEKAVQATLEKYKELYAYSTDILLKEHERFTRADEKASQYATTFVFLIGIAAYFDKWVFDRLQWPEFPVGLPPDWPLLVVGMLALIGSAAGLFLTNHAMKLRPVVSRPRNQDILDFFEKQTLLNIYYGFSRENSNAYETNKKATDQKYTVLKWAYNLLKLVLALLAELLVMYCLYSWC